MHDWQTSLSKVRSRDNTFQKMKEILNVVAVTIVAVACCDCKCYDSSGMQAVIIFSQHDFICNAIQTNCNDQLDIKKNGFKKYDSI